MPSGVSTTARRPGSGTGISRSYEALARASSLAGDAERAASWREQARAAGDAIVDPEDREHFEQDFATL
jgi:hypothetical protein